MAYHAAAGPQLAGVVDSVPAMPLAMMLHAIPGWGKTSFAAQIPNTIFLMVGNERGFLTLLGRGLIPKTPHFKHPATTANEVRLAINELLIGDHNYKNLTIDVFNEVQRLYFQEAIDRDYGGNAGKFLDFGGTKGPEEVAQKDMPDLLGRLDELRYKRGMSITLLSHTATPKHTNPTTGDTFNYYAPALAKPITENIGRWADAVLFGQHEIQAAKAKRRTPSAASIASFRPRTTPHGLPRIAWASAAPSTAAHAPKNAGRTSWELSSSPRKPAKRRS